MKIIRMGVIPEDKEYEITCSRCTTVFQFSKKESTESPDQRNSGCGVILCPVCHTYSYFNYNRCEIK